MLHDDPRPLPQTGPLSTWLHAVCENATEGLLVEQQERIVYVNRAYARFLGYASPAELLLADIRTTVFDEDAARLVDFGRRRLYGQKAPGSYEFVARHRNGSPVRLRATVWTVDYLGQRLITTLAQPSAPAPTADAPNKGAAVAHDGQLSPREHQVLRMILEGQRLKEIALSLDLSVKTVSTHRTRIMRKLQLSSNRDLFRHALRRGWVDWV